MKQHVVQSMKILLVETAQKATNVTGLTNKLSAKEAK